MSTVFLRLFNMSVTASWLILAVVLARQLLKKAPRWISCLLWGLVAVRLLLPVSFRSSFSMVPSRETIPLDIVTSERPAIDSGIPVIDDAVNSYMEQTFAPPAQHSTLPLQTLIRTASFVWLTGAAVLLLYALASYLKLKRTVLASVPAGEGICACDEVETPFILGIFRPVIYVPSSMEGKMLDIVIRHEKAHLYRLDHWWKPLGFLLLAVYWFNPLCWLAYILLCRDIEFACDERVIRDMDEAALSGYSQALLDCSFPRKSIIACPVAFGEVGVKSRVRNVLNYKRPAFWILLASVAVCIAITVFLMSDPTPRNSLTALIRSGTVTAFDSTGTWCYTLSGHDREILEECAASSSVLNADQLKKKVASSNGPSCQLVMTLGGKSESQMPADAADSTYKLETSYYEDLNLSVIADASKGTAESERLYYVTEGKAVKTLYGRWNNGAFSSQPTSLRIDCKTYGFSVEAIFERRDGEGHQHEEYSCSGESLSAGMRNLLSSSRLEQLTVVTSIPTIATQNEIVNAMGSIDHDVDVWLMGLVINGDVKINECINTLHLIDCDMSGADWSSLNVAELHMTACTRLDWSGFGTADRVQRLYISGADDWTLEEAKASGCYPKDSSVFVDHPGLKGIAFAVRLRESDLDGLSRTLQLTSEQGSIPRELEHLLPYPMAEIRVFLNDSQRTVWIIWEELV